MKVKYSHDNHASIRLARSLMEPRPILPKPIPIFLVQTPLKQPLKYNDFSGENETNKKENLHIQKLKNRKASHKAREKRKHTFQEMKETIAKLRSENCMLIKENSHLKSLNLTNNNLHIKNHTLQLTNNNLQLTNTNIQLENHTLQLTNSNLQLTNNNLQLENHTLHQLTNNNLQLTNSNLQLENHTLHQLTNSNLHLTNNNLQLENHTLHQLTNSNLQLTNTNLQLENHTLHQLSNNNLQLRNKTLMQHKELDARLEHSIILRQPEQDHENYLQPMAPRLVYLTPPSNTAMRSPELMTPSSSQKKMTATPSYIDLALTTPTKSAKSEGDPGPTAPIEESFVDDGVHISAEEAMTLATAAVEMMDQLGWLLHESKNEPHTETHCLVQSGNFETHTIRSISKKYLF